MYIEGRSFSDVRAEIVRVRAHTALVRELNNEVEVLRGILQIFQRINNNERIPNRSPPPPLEQQLYTSGLIKQRPVRTSSRISSNRAGAPPVHEPSFRERSRSRTPVLAAVDQSAVLRSSRGSTPVVGRTSRSSTPAVGRTSRSSTPAVDRTSR
eukprot:Pgem_evm1s3322